MSVFFCHAYPQGFKVRPQAERWSSYRVPVLISRNKIAKSTRREIAQLMARSFEAGYEFAKTNNAIIDHQGFIAEGKVVNASSR